MAGVIIAAASARHAEEEAHLLLTTSNVTWKAAIEHGFMGHIKLATVEARTLDEIVKWLADNPAANPKHGCVVSFRGLGLSEWHCYETTIDAKGTADFVKQYREDTGELAVVKGDKESYG